MTMPERRIRVDAQGKAREMIQFYLLSVVLNILGGLALVQPGKMPEKAGRPVREGIFLILTERGVMLVIAILSVAVGILKLVFALRGDIPVIGDFLPAVSGIVVGSVLLFRDCGQSCPGWIEKHRRAAGILNALLSGGEAVGYTGIIAGIAHFLFPMVIFL